MADTPVVYRPVGGIGNPQVSTIDFPETKVLDAENWLFEYGAARPRPNLSLKGNYAFTEDVVFGHAALIPDRATTSDSIGLHVLSILSDDSLVRTNPTIATLTGPGVTMEDPEFFNITTVNGNFIVGANQGGMVRYVPTDSAYTVVSDAQYRYFTGHFSRAVGAYGNTASDFKPQTVAWSVAGDETDWTGEGSGSAIRAEIPDFITGIRNLKNVLVILRLTGIDLAYATGSNTLGPFRFETFLRDGPGCAFPSTVGSDNNQLLFVGVDDVYRFQLGQQPEAVGFDVRDELLSYLNRGTVFYGFITREGLLGASDSVLDLQPYARTRYHLWPYSGPSDAPHYVLDLQNGAWSRHRYDIALTALLPNWEENNLNEQHRRLRHNEFLAPSTGSVVERYLWVSHQLREASPTPDKPATLSSRVLRVGNPTYDYQLNRVMISMKVTKKAGEDVNPPLMRVAARAKQQGRLVSAETMIDVDIDERRGWQNIWVDLRLTGQYFQYDIEVPYQLGIDIEEITGMYSEHSISRSSSIARED